MVKKTGFSFLSHDKKTTIHGKKWAPADGNYRSETWVRASWR
jgi:hypothetical protein